MQLIQLVINGLVNGVIISLAAVGISLTYGVLKLINFAAGDYLTFSAYLVASLTVSFHVPLLISIVLGMLTLAIFSVGMDFVLWKRLRKKRAGQLAQFLSAIGLSFIIRQMISLFYGPDNKSFPIDFVKQYRFGSLHISHVELNIFLVSMVAMTALILFLSRTSTGKSMRAYSDNPSLASVSGVNVEKVIIVTWIISGLLGALAGVFQGMAQSSFLVDMGWQLQLSVFAAVVLGTIGNAYGAMIGGLVIGVLMNLATWSGFFGGVSGAYMNMVAFVTLILCLLFRPQGFFGFKSRGI